MIFCSKCGASNEDGAQFCKQCGSSLFEGAEETVKAMSESAPVSGMQDANEKLFEEVLPQQPQVAPQQNFAPYQSVASVQPLSPKCKTFGIIGFILGLTSLVFCWLGIIPAAGIACGIILIVCAILALVFSGISRREGTFKLAKLAKIFGIIGLILSAICMIIGIIIMAIAMQNGGFTTTM